MELKFSKKIPKKIHTRIWGCDGYPTDSDLTKRTNTKQKAKRYTKRWLRRLNKEETRKEFDIREDSSIG